MPKPIRQPDVDKILLDNIESLCRMQGVEQEEQRLIMRMSPATYYRRKSDPMEFKVGELVKIAERLGVTVSQLLTERKFVA